MCCRTEGSHHPPAGKGGHDRDGINDAPALTTDIHDRRARIAMDAAESSLKMDASAAVRLSRQTYRNILENLSGRSLQRSADSGGAGAYVRLRASPWIPSGRRGHQLSTSVVSNAPRLNLFRSTAATVN